MWDFKPHCELPNYQQPHTQQPAHESWGKVWHASRGLRGTEYSFRFFCLGEKSTCLSTSSSLWRQDRNQAKEDLGGRGNTTHYMLVWKPHVPNRKQGRCPLVIPASFQSSHGSQTPMLQTVVSSGTHGCSITPRIQNSPAAPNTTGTFTKQREQLPRIARQQG